MCAVISAVAATRMTDVLCSVCPCAVLCCVLMCCVAGVHYVFDKSAMAGDSTVAAQLLLFSVSLHYLQNISSIYFLAHVSVLSHQVAQSLKRLLVIACSVFYFHTPVTALNVVGMSLALVGFFAYSLTKQSAAAAAAGNVNGDGWSASGGKSQHSPHGNGLYNSHPLSDREGRESGSERGYYSGGTQSSRLRMASQPNTPRQAGDQQYLSHSPTSLSSSATPSTSTSPALHPSDSGVMDSYALVRASELGSSHLLQSPATGPVQPQLRYSHAAHNSYLMQPLSLAPHQQQQQQQQRRASRDHSAGGGTLQFADGAGQHSAHSHVVELEEHAALLSAHDGHGTSGAHNGHGMR